MKRSNFLICVFALFSLVAFPRKATFFEGKTEIEDPFNLRDPFKQPIFKQKKNKKNYNVVGKNTFTNIESPNVITLSDIKVIGIMLGPKRRALVNVGASKVPRTMSEGDKISQVIELKAILPGGLVFVEKLVNVYGQQEFLETVVPISENN